MPGISGLKFAEQVREVAPNVIFTTGHINYGPAAFKVRAKHYLVKPIDQLDFIEAISSVASGLDIEQEEVPVEISFVRTHISNERIKIAVKDIVLIESDKNYVNIITNRKVHRVYMTVKEMAEKLKHNKNFYQVRKSAIVNSDYIEKVEGNAIDLVKWEVVMTKEFKKNLADFIDANTLTSNRCSIILGELPVVFVMLTLVIVGSEAFAKFPLLAWKVRIVFLFIVLLVNFFILFFLNTAQKYSIGRCACLILLNP
ncbi:MAG: response regulator transcription factor, partial [Pedobacter sp.]